MFIDRDTTNITSPFGGADGYLMSTGQVEFRPPNGVGGVASSAINISPRRGEIHPLSRVGFPGLTTVS